MKDLVRYLIFLLGLAGLSVAQTTRTTLAGGCPCQENHTDPGTDCLTDVQMPQYVKHVEMEPDRMGNHTNLQGVAVFRIAFDKHGRVDCAEALSGHPIAISLLMASLGRWRFKRFVRNGTSVRACGRLSVRFSVAEGRSTVKVISQD
jgi:hypothetical protein